MTDTDPYDPFSLTHAYGARHAAERSYPGACDLAPITGDYGHLLGWTFATTIRRTAYGWILMDGRISPATEPYRSYAEQYAWLSIPKEQQ